MTPEAILRRTLKINGYPDLDDAPSECPMVALDALVAERDDALARAACQVEASIRLKSEWEAERDALAARLAEAERQRDDARGFCLAADRDAKEAEARVAALTEALRHLIEWADDERGDAFGEREWADARAALAAADRPEGTTQEGNA